MVEKEVVLKGNMQLFKQIKIGEAVVYWYKLKDQTGQILVSSMEELRKGKYTLTGKVKRSETGRWYIKLKNVL